MKLITRISNTIAFIDKLKIRLFIVFFLEIILLFVFSYRELPIDRIAYLVNEWNNKEIVDFSSSSDLLLREETVTLDEDILRPLDFAIYNDTTFVIPDYSGESRFLKVSCEGKLIEKIGAIPTTNEKALQEVRH